MGDLKRTIARARELRANATTTERFLWQHLRLRQIDGYKFRRQRPVGPYVVDFICLEKRLVIEVDGGQHNTQGPQDAKREAWLRQEHYTVLRFWNHEVLTQIETVKNVISSTLNATPLLNPPPRRGRT
jgi:very-short-patch-repair endonuclease